MMKHTDNRNQHIGVRWKKASRKSIEKTQTLHISSLVNVPPRLSRNTLAQGVFLVFSSILSNSNQHSIKLTSWRLHLKVYSGNGHQCLRP